MTKKVFVIGAGGHAKVLIDCIRGLGFYCIQGVIENDQDKIGQKISDIDIISESFFLNHYKPDEVFLVNGIGSIGLPLLRKKIFLSFKEKNYHFETLVHPTAYVAHSVTLGEGCQVLAKSVLQVDVKIGDNVLINNAAVIDHDSSIGDHSHVAPGAIICGGVTIESDNHIGSSATIIQGMHVQKNCIIAAGSVVISEVKLGSRIAGVPAKLIHQITE